MMRLRRFSFSTVVIAGMWTAAIFLFLMFPSLFQFGSKARSISIYSWTDMIDPDVITRFELETGIKVYISYFENNQELFLKLQATKGAGYDLIMPSDYIIPALINEGLIKQLDKTKVTIFDRINPVLKGRYYDRENNYAIPYYWSVYGIGLDRNFFKKVPEPSWKLLFKAGKQPYSVVMISEPREALLLAAQYLFGTIDNLSKEQMKQVETLLVEQKKMVEVYADSLSEYFLLAHICPVILTNTPAIWRVLQKNPHIEFLFPREGSFMVNDCFALTQMTNKDDLIYTFINYIYQEEFTRHHFHEYRFFPATVDLLELFKEADVPQPIVDAHTKYVDQLDSFRSVLPEQKIQNIWLQVKSS